MTNKELTDKAAKIKAQTELMAEINFSVKRLKKENDKVTDLKDIRKLIAFDRVTQNIKSLNYLEKQDGE